MILSELFRKWFGLETPRCHNCDMWRDLLERSEAERASLLDKLLALSTPKEAKEEIVKVEEFKPILPQKIPWRVRQQMLENEDRQAAALLRNRKKEIDELERELGIDEDLKGKEDASQERKTV